MGSAILNHLKKILKGRNLICTMILVFKEQNEMLQLTNFNSAFYVALIKNQFLSNKDRDTSAVCLRIMRPFTLRESVLNPVQMIT